jgi:peptidoglycan hydrolase-like protein with peptidoglycan-binding domain
MMRGRTDGLGDPATLARVQQLNGLLRRLGYDSVKAFQQRNRLTADGVMGRRTEQRALDLLRRRAPGRSGTLVAASGRHRRGG